MQTAFKFDMGDRVAMRTGEGYERTGVVVNRFRTADFESRNLYVIEHDVPFKTSFSNDLACFCVWYEPFLRPNPQPTEN